MDPIVLAAGTALVSAMATDAWQQARSATVAMWRGRRPEHAERVGEELDALRTQVLAARQQEDRDTERALASVWQLQLQQALLADPGFVAELRRLVADHLEPLLAQDERGRTGPAVMKAEARDNARVYMAGRDQHITDR